MLEIGIVMIINYNIQCFILCLLLLLPVSLKAQSEYNYEFALIEASRQKSIGNLNEAILLYRRCLEVNPNSAVAAYELGSIYAAANQLDISEQLLQKAYNLDRQNYWYLLAYTEILKANKNYLKAEEILEEYLKIKKDTKLKYSLANIYRETGKTKKAYNTLEEIEKDNGVSELVILKKIEILKEKKDFERAENELDKLITIMPEAPEYKILMAEFLVEIGQNERAKDFFLEAYKLDTTNIYAITSLAEYYTKVENYRLGFYYLEKALIHPAINLDKKIQTISYYISRESFINKYQAELTSIIKSMILVYPENADIKILAVDFYNRINDYDNSLSILEMLIDEDPDNAEYIRQAVFAASVKNRYDKIIRIAEQGIKIFPNMKEFYLYKAIALYQEEKYQDSYKILLKEYEAGMNPGIQMQFLTFLGESSYKVGKKEESFQYFEELLLLDPGNLVVMNNYSYYLALEGTQLDRAEELSKKTLEAEPDNQIYLDTYGWILFRMGKYLESEKYLGEAVKSSSDADLLFHYAEVLMKLGEIKRAREFYLKAGENGYDEKEIQSKLALCQ